MQLTNTAMEVNYDLYFKCFEIIYNSPCILKWDQYKYSLLYINEQSVQSKEENNLNC